MNQDPGKGLITGVHQFDGTEYTVWAALMEAVLATSNLNTVIEEAKPENADADWSSKDKKARAILLLALSRDIVKGVVHLKTAREIWEKLRQLHERKTAANLIQIQQDFYNAKMNTGESISSYATRIESIASHMRDFGEEVSRKSLNGKIVHGLPPEYKHFMSSWIGTPDQEQTYDNLLSRLQAEEAIINGSEKCESIALKARTNHKRTYDKTNKKDIECYYCHKKGHIKKDCRKRQKDEAKDSGDHGSGGKALGAMTLAASSSRGSDKETWLIDTGASRHMTMNRHWLRDYEKFKEKVPVKVGNSEVIYGLGSGKVDAISFVENKQIKVTIHDVMYVPEISDNLFSAGQADERGLKYVSAKGKIKFIKGDEVLATGKKFQGNMYKLNIKVPVRANIAKQERTLEEWHEVLGHPDKRKLQEMARTKAVDGYKIVEKSADETCGPCQLGKGHRTTHGDSERTRAPEILFRVHTDLVGPIMPPSLSGYRYFMLIKDEYSSYTFVRFLTSKAHVLNTIKKFIAEVSTLTQKRVKIIRSDNGKEFTNQGMKVLCEYEGIQQELSCVYTPEQNGEAERANRTILETARTILQASKLPLSLWAEAVNSAVYVRNRVSNRRTGDVTPYEMFHGRKPDLSNLMKFGQEVHILNNERGISKFSAKTKEAYVVGYGDRVNTYRCLTPNSTEVTITADLVPARHTDKSRERLELNRPWVPFLIEQEREVEPTSFNRAQETSREATTDISDAQSINLQEVDDDVARVNCTLEAPTSESVEAQEVERASRVNATSRIPVLVTAPAEQTAPAQSTANAKESQTSRELPTQRVVNKVQFDWSLKDREPRNTKSVYAKRPFSAKIACSEPTSFSNAIEAPDAKDWKKAIAAELSALKKNNTWEIVPKSRDMKEITAKWIFKIKYDATGNIERYKARLVARGFTQIQGVDFNEIFAPVVRMDSVRLLFSLCTQLDLKFRQFDIATAFLNGEIEEKLYLTPPEGLEVPENHTCRLLKSLYGLRQAPRCWNKKFAEMLNIFDMRQTQSDPCVYVTTDPELIYLAIYVDDGLVFARNEKTIDRVFGYLTKHFEVRTVDSRCFIGVEITRRSDGSIYLNQRGYIKRMLDKFNMTDSKFVSTPLETGHTLNTQKVLNKEPLAGVPYAEAVGSLMYCALATRPDIVQVLSILSKYNSCPREEHWKAVKRVFRYLNGTRDIGLVYKKVETPKIVCYTDADWAGDHESRKSLSGMVSFITTGPISYKSQQQPVVALSTTESEYIAATVAIKELIWMQRFIGELKAPIAEGAILRCDNQSAIKLIRNPEFHQRTKHIDIRYHYIRECYMNKCFSPEYVETNLQKADIFTKPLSADKFEKMKEMIGCISIKES